MSKHELLDKSDDPTLLWSALRLNNDSTVREKIIDFYHPFARMMAAKAYAKRTTEQLEFLDFLQYALVGLIEAIDRFEHDRDIKFETFASTRINGAILKGIETSSDKQGQLSARRRVVAERLKSLKDNAVDAQDPSTMFGYLAEIAIGLAVGFALEDSGMHQIGEPTYPDNTYKRVEMKQLHHRIKGLLTSLPDNERRIVKYHYLQDIGFEEIAHILDVTRGRVSQLHKNALRKLRDAIRGEGKIDLRC